MKQVVQSTSGGPVRVLEVPMPGIGPTEVLVRTVASVISPGTERAVTELARSSLLAKARARPDLVREVVRRARIDGVARTARTVRDRLEGDIPLGYSAAGIALEVGEAVAGISPGQLVATGGAGKANHAEFQAAPGLLCVPVPPGVPAGDAAFATVASVPLHALRLAGVGPGAKVAIVGLGLIGQLAVRLAQAAGCDAAGIDVADFPVRTAEKSGALALVESGQPTTEAIVAWSRGAGVDAVLVTAAGRSSEVMARVPELCRDRAHVVIVGDVGLQLDRRPFYDRELTLQFARSYGPGRYERAYEEWAVDYPPGSVRWTEGRNLAAVLDLLASGRLRVGDLVTHRFDIAEAADAYALIAAGSPPLLGVQLTYPATSPVDQPVPLRPAHAGPGLGIGLIGAGAFATTVLVPAFTGAGFQRLVSVASASGLSARQLGSKAGFERCVSGADGIIADADVDIVIIATPHSSHAELAARALRAGKHVFCEKPLALSMEELDDVEEAWRESGMALFVGFNRRWSTAVAAVRRHFASGHGPLVVTYRVNAGSLPASHWYNDRREGGRLLGEVCHFVDTCAAIVGSDAVAVHTFGSGPGERLLAQDLVVSLRYGDGSLATISYASGGHHGVAKERIEVLGRDRSAAVDDFREVVLDGRAVTGARQDKGHRSEVRAFRGMVAGEAGAGGAADATASALASTRTTLLAAQELTRGA